MIGLFLSVFVVAAFAETTTESGQCEDYGEKVTEGWETSTLARDDPCFGYGYNCCIEYIEYCYWKDTYNCNNCELDVSGSGCSACCDSYDNTPSPTNDPTVQETPAPTAHSAKKWTMLHPDYEGGDGELLWNIYYGDYSDDQRFDAFRKDQLWDAQVIRPMIEMDDKYKRFQLAQQSVNVPRNEQAIRFGHYQWLILAAVIVTIGGVYAALYRGRFKTQIKTVDADEVDSLLVGYGATRK